MFGKRILILAAHPDDEVVACAAAIGRAQTRGAEIFVLFMTHGCIARETMWVWDRRNYEKHVARRRTEGEQAAKFLGITPVGWSPRPARHLWRELKEAHEEIKVAAAQYSIDQLWVPAYEGGNADHDALNAIGSKNRLNPLPLLSAEALAKADVGRVREGEVQQEPSHPPVLEFAEYNFSGGEVHSQEFLQPHGNKHVIILTDAEKEKKQAALKIYESEKGNLDYVKTERECFRLLASYDYSRPPHEGTLWYTRFQWVPFRHPRVDFTDPQEVSIAITAFLK